MLRSSTAQLRRTLMQFARVAGVLLIASVLGAGSLLVLAADAPTSTVPSKERRLALVIGNSNYPFSPLRNSVNDARDFAAALKDSGFEVTVLENAKLRDTRNALREFGDRLKAQGGVGLFYYAGHGMQVKGRNYLIPVAAQIEREDEVEFESLDANQVLEKLDSAGNRFNIVILDACRNNPFARAFRSSTQGLAQMDAPSGAVVAFATAPGSVASDGAGRNGLYTQYLIENVQRPGLKIEEVFKQVRASVRRDSNGMQTPWESTSLEGDFYFHPVDRAALDAARKQQEQARIEEAVRLAVAQERERMRMEYEIAQAKSSAQPILASATESKPAPASIVIASAIDSRPTISAAGLTRPAQSSGIAEYLRKQSESIPTILSMVPENAELVDAFVSPDSPGSTVALKSTPPVAELPLTIGQRDRRVIPLPEFEVGDEWEQIRVTSYAGTRLPPVPTFDKSTVATVQPDNLVMAYVVYDPPNWTPSTEVFRNVNPTMGSLFDAAGAEGGHRQALTFPLDVGKAWSYTYEHDVPNLGRARSAFNARVVDWEQVTVQAGTFWALKIQQLGWVTGLAPGPKGMERAYRADLTLWYSPEAKYVVKSVYQTYAPFGTDTALSTTTVQLVRFRNPSANPPAPTTAAK
jgi:Caspase domain